MTDSTIRFSRPQNKRHYLPRSFFGAVIIR